jgi:hypothetical protein
MAKPARFPGLGSKISGCSPWTAPRGTAGSWSQGGLTVTEIHRQLGDIDRSRGCCMGQLRPRPLGLHSVPHDAEPQTLEPLDRSHPAHFSHLTLVTARGENACADSPEISHAGGSALFFFWSHLSRYEKQGRVSALLLVSNCRRGSCPDMCVRRPKKRFRFPASHR